MSDKEDRALIKAFEKAARAVEHLPPEQRTAVIAALRALWPDKPAVVNQALPHGWQTSGQLSSAERSVLQSLVPIGPTKYGDG